MQHSEATRSLNQYRLINVKYCNIHTVCNQQLHLRKGRCSAGVKNGLQLVVNIEQYQYTKGPNNAVGLKFRLHNQGVIPVVQDIGDNVPAGMHTFVAVSVSKVSTISLTFNCGPGTRLGSGNQWAKHKRYTFYLLFMSEMCDNLLRNCTERIN